MAIQGEFRIENATPPHHRYWDEALQDAVNRVAADREIAPNEPHTYEVRFAVEVIKTNPGWINRYIVELG
ncbi:MAG TPA: hypothetical protein VFB26_04145 [Gaiellaceae bacterium]|nr:hypothetical protein [Gaiellaceae bacterium]